ncbi:MAG: hypothetical protein CL687_02930 [Candidatus Pelagibacter sp.]|nr:hypothetical protein [Candidatus Pelagibacter sp.]OUW23949.1 MAG: hypothetical protein CBD34_01660 [Rickettsiales bacterium TMED174]
MCYKKKFALIDSQDAVIGYPLYDVASLIDDVRIKLPSNLQSKILNYYMNKCDLKPFDKIKIKTDFEILSVQRNLRILGVFARLYKRDNKHNYLKYLPYTWKLIERRIKSPTFKSLNILIKKIS